MNRHSPLKSTKMLLSVLLFAVLPLCSCADKNRSRSANSVALPVPATEEASHTEAVVLTGNELEVVSRYIRSPIKPGASRFANVLDQAMWALLTKAYPQQERTSLVTRTVANVCRQTQRLSGHEVPEETRNKWVRQVLTQGSFEGTLKEAEGLLPNRSSRRDLIDAGLHGMLDSVGWLLDDAQARELTNISTDREAGTERGLLGIDVSRWPTISPAPGGPAEKAGLQDGDVVLKVGGSTVEKVHSGSEAVALLAGPADQEVPLTIQRGAEILSFRVRRVAAAARLIRDKVVAPGVVYIKIPTFEGTGIAEKAEQILREQMSAGLRAVILDLRNNPGGRPEPANAIADLFLDNAVLVVFEFRSGQRVAVKSHPGALDAPVVILTNRNTGSGAEMLAMALRDNRRATIIGEPTAGALFGKDAQQLDDGRTIVLRCEPRILSPAGKDYSTNGIPPDVTVASAEGTGEDEALHRAIEAAVGQAARSQPATGTDE